ncbi:uncharacterized protein [Dendropsophus ebraccatus]|uniref:uncharacterized protein n=1 Tax=Dendropsophus ebraccatus TaxID=150705 RepID=UPI00383162AA
MSETSFVKLLAMVGPLITKQDTAMRRAITAEQRLTATLRFLATGRALQDLKYSAGISAASLCGIIPETCEAIVAALSEEYIKCPQTPEQWLEIAEEFGRLWNFPNCGGAMDGKHVRIVQPAASGSFFYNYENFFSIIFLALVNANYEFVFVGVGRNGRVSDGGVFANSQFAHMLRSNSLSLPNNDVTHANLNFVFVADEAFPLTSHILKPYPQRLLNRERQIFNYRLARARRVVENAFGIMANRFRVLHTPINLMPHKVDKVVLACCVLHNFLRMNDSNSYSPPAMLDTENLESFEVIPGEWHASGVAMTSLQRQQHVGRPSADAVLCRQQYCHFFNGPGAVELQNAIVHEQAS